MIRQKSYKGCYNIPGLTSGELRKLAELLEYEALPTDPYTIMACESAGLIVNLESGELTSELAPGIVQGNVRDFPPLSGEDMPPMLTLIDVLKMPMTTLAQDGRILWWSEYGMCYLVSDGDDVREHKTCVAALNQLIGGGNDS